MTIDFARNVMGLTGANSTEMDPTTPSSGDRPHARPARRRRQGRHDAARRLLRRARTAARQVAAAYGEPVVSERHRHRYELNAKYRAAARGRRAVLQRARRPTTAGRVHRAARTIRSGSARRPTPSSRAAPTGRTRCSASWSRAAWPGRRDVAGAPICARSTARSKSPAGVSRRPSAAFRSRSATDWSTRATSGTSSSPTSTTPTASGSTRDIVRSPGAVGVVPLVFDAEGNPSVVLVAQYRPPLRPSIARDPGRDARRRRARPPTRSARRELIEEVGLSAGRLELLTEIDPSPGMTDSVLHDLPGDRLPPRRPRSARSRGAVHGGAAPAVARRGRSVVSGEINDAKTVVGLLLADRRLAARRRLTG